jgi:hypothetical protein
MRLLNDSTRVTEIVTDLASGRVEEILEQHRLRYLFVPELELYLRTAGPEHLNKWMSNAPASSKSWNVVMPGRAATGEK